MHTQGEYSGVEDEFIKEMLRIAGLATQEEAVDYAASRASCVYEKQANKVLGNVRDMKILARCGGRPSTN